MSKISGKIGYALIEETQPGIWTEKIIEKQYYGEIIKNNRKISDVNGVSSDISITNTISIISNGFMITNIPYIKYISFMNSKWKIKSVDIRPPRLILSLGGLYNGE